MDTVSVFVTTKLHSHCIQPCCPSLMLCLWSHALLSSSMFSVLYRHRKQIRHIHRTTMSPRSSPESRVTKHILLLVSSYLCFYTLSYIFQVCLSLTYNPSFFLVNISAIIVGFFPAFNALLLLRCESRVSRLCFACIRNGKAPIM